ncbi:MAG: type 1 glutamine amidotransferase [Geminicoccaceae bacterium]
MAISAPILVFHHMPDEHLGYLFDRLRDNGIDYRVFRVHEGEPIPDLEAYSALWVLGGSMQVWEEDEHPWLLAEKDAVRRAVLALDMPYFGVCFGHQLLASALGGVVGLAETAEVGVVRVDLNEEGKSHALLETLPPNMNLQQWHSAEVKDVPTELTVLAHSEACRIHAIAYGDRVLGMQSHIEVSMASIDEWVSIPAARAELERRLGPDGPAMFQADARCHMPEINKAASQLYEKLVAAIDRAEP